MEKTKYIKPEIDVVAHLAQPFLAGTIGNVIEGEDGKTTPGMEDGGGTSNPGDFARRQFNLWDEWDEE